MHELGIATSILDTVEKEATKYPGKRFERVGLRIGEVAGVDVDALTFGWEAITKDTKWESLSLEIERVPRKNRCDECGSVFAVQDFTELTCPDCEAFPTICISGDELDIAYIEIGELEEADIEPCSH
jgi:hydrogenase nickel incorporation protein HypA/HybF